MQNMKSNTNPVSKLSMDVRVIFHCSLSASSSEALLLKMIFVY